MGLSKPAIKPVPNTPFERFLAYCYSLKGSQIQVYTDRSWSKPETPLEFRPNSRIYVEWLSGGTQGCPEGFLSVRIR